MPAVKVETILRSVVIPPDHERRYWYLDVMCQGQRLSLLAKEHASALVMQSELHKLLSQHLEPNDE